MLRRTPKRSKPNGGKTVEKKQKLQCHQDNSGKPLGSKLEKDESEVILEKVVLGETDEILEILEETQSRQVCISYIEIFKITL